jgi:hypothetical protein
MWLGDILAINGSLKGKLLTLQATHLLTGVTAVCYLTNDGNLNGLKL